MREILYINLKKGYSGYKAVDNVVEKNERIILYIQKSNPIYYLEKVLNE